MGPVKKGKKKKARRYLAFDSKEKVGSVLFNLGYRLGGETIRGRKELEGGGKNTTQTIIIRGSIKRRKKNQEGGELPTRNEIALGPDNASCSLGWNSTKESWGGKRGYRPKRVRQSPETIPLLMNARPTGGRTGSMSQRRKSGSFGKGEIREHEIVEAHFFVLPETDVWGGGEQKANFLLRGRWKNIRGKKNG